VPVLRRKPVTRPRCCPFRHQRMNIPQVEHGGNGESDGVVNQWLLFGMPPGLRPHPVADGIDIPEHWARPRFVSATEAAVLATEIAQLPAQILRDKGVHSQIDGGSVFQPGGKIPGRGVDFLDADDLVDLQPFRRLWGFGGLS
jgi:hypothetical protein